MKRLILFLIVIVLLISGCAKTEKQVVEQSFAPTSATENITASTPIIDTEQATEGIIQADNPPTHGIISEYHPIVIKPPRFGCGILCGGFNQKWLTEDEVSAFIKGKEEYKLLNLTDNLGIGLGDTVSTDNTPIPYTIDIQSNLSDDKGFLAISCDWNPLPRAPVKQSNLSEEYNNIVSKILEENGLKDVPVNVVQNYKIDIEGDGQDEVLLCAQNIEALGLGATSKKNTYSLLILRRIVNGQVVNVFLEKSIYLEDGGWGDGIPVVLNIEAIADLNGDGVMEIVVGFLYYEGDGYDVYELRDNQVESVIGTVSGGL